MGVGTLISIEEYLRTSFDPDCDFVEGEVVERNVGKRRHGYAQARIPIWFAQQQDSLHLEPLTELRIRVAPRKIRIPDVVLTEQPIPDEEVLTSPPYLCVEIMSSDDTMASIQDRLDDYLAFGVLNILGDRSLEASRVASDRRRLGKGGRWHHANR